MVLNNSILNQEFLRLYDKFMKEHYRLSKLAKDKKKDDIDRIIPKPLRLLRVRLRLILGLVIDFDTTYSLTKAEKVKDTYIHIFKCNEAWFAYEGLIKLVQSKEKLERFFYKIPQAHFQDNYQTQDILVQINEILLSILKIDKNKNEAQKYLIELKNTMEPQAVFLKQCLQSFSVKIDSKGPITDFEILALIYATRNVFVHKGESAFFGEISYRTKCKLLEVGYDYMILLLLKSILYYYSTIGKKIKAVR